MLLKIWIFYLMVFVETGSIDFKNVEPTVCVTEECKEFARRILTNVNASMDPCVDFYEYACGNWPKTHPLQAGENTWQIRVVSANENKRKVEEMLNAEFQGDEILTMKIAKQWYKTCTNTEAMDQRGMEPLMIILNEIGGWPITMPGNYEGGQKWQDVDDYYAHLRGSNLLHDVRVTSYGNNSNHELTTVLDVPDMPPYSWMLDEYFDSNNVTVGEKKDFKKVEKYWKFVLKIVSSIVGTEGFNITKNQLEDDIEDILEFEWKLSKITTLLDDYVNMTVKDFQRWYNDLGPSTENSMVNWTAKVIGIFKTSNIDISEDTNLRIASPSYFKKLIPLLDETSNRIIVNYLHWNFVSSTITKTTNAMRKLYEGMVENITEEQESRFDLCIDEAKMKDVVAYEYTRIYFSNDTMKMALDALDDIKEEMEVDIKESNWMNEEIKDLALRRIRSVKKNIGYPDWYNNASIIGTYFGELEMGPTYYENALRFQRYYKSKELRLLMYKDAVEPWLVDPLTINAFYLTKSNSITLPLANLQKPFFSTAQPNIINYALTGYLLAHELYHPFDEQRRLYSEHGEQISWPETMTREYYKSAQCFIEQYNNYTLDGSSLGPKIENYGNQTFDENMSDTMGLRTAFRAYKRRELKNGKSEPTLPGLQMFTNDQLFFLASANLWCENRDSETLVTSAKLDVHSIARLRCIGSLSNNQDFVDAFSCPLDSLMNRMKKCNIWKA